MKAWLIGLLMIVFATFSFAEEGEVDVEKELNGWQMLGVGIALEGLIAINAALAAESPEGYGWTVTLLSPMGATGKDKWGDRVGVAMFAMMGQYNAHVLKKGFGKREIFRRNMVVFNAGVFVGGLAAWGLKKLDAPKELSIQPTQEQGLALAYSKQF